MQILTERRLIMKNGKKIILIALVVVLIASTLLAFTGPGKWVRIKQGQDLSVNIGRAGVAFTDSFYAGVVNIYRPSDNGYKPPKGFQFTQDFLRVKFFDDKWEPVKVVTGAVYVFFDLRPAERRAYDAARIGIAYFDTWKGTWKMCPTMVTNGGTRAVCRIRNFGLYALMYRDP
jgi:hypothetical protein